MRELINIVNEGYLAGSRAPLYHSTSLISAIQIVKENVLDATRGAQEARVGTLPHDVISFTRNLDFAKKWRTHAVIFVLDQEKLRRHYAIYPYDYFHPNQKNVDIETNKRTEAEEFVTRSIKPLMPYLIEIMVFRAGIMRFRNLILNGKVSAPANPRKPLTGDNVKFVRTFKGLNDPALANTVWGPWLERSILLKHPLTRIID